MRGDLPTLRQTHILEWLQEQGTLTIDEVASRLNISAMTVHRDLAQLVQTGVVVKVHGGITLPKKQSQPANPAPVCKLCTSLVNERTTAVIQSSDGETLYACCPHCALILLTGMDNVISALGRDFIYGRMVNLQQAFFVVESEVILCCVPSILCFASENDARRFQAGFAGSIQSSESIQRHLQQTHHHGHTHL
jgi:hypothetical protein